MRTEAENSGMVTNPKGRRDILKAGSFWLRESVKTAAEREVASGPQAGAEGCCQSRVLGATLALQEEG